MDIEPFQVALSVADALEGCGVPHVLGGSLASSASGEPRSTLDIDLVVAMTQADVEPFLTALGRAFDADDHALRYGLARARARPVDTLSRTPDLAGGDREGIAVVRGPPYPPSGTRSPHMQEIHRIWLKYEEGGILDRLPDTTFRTRPSSAS